MEVEYKQVSPKAIKVRNLNRLVTSSIRIVISSVLLFCAYEFNWWSWLQYVWIGFVTLSLIRIVWTYLVSSKMFFKRFRYGLTDDYLYIKSGIWTISEIVAPMTKIQSIELTQGVIMRKYGISSLVISTLKESHEIPYVEQEVAMKLRDDIAKLARLKELDE